MANTVEFEYTSGTRKRMPLRYAQILHKLGKGEYLTTQMRAGRRRKAKPVEAVAVQDIPVVQDEAVPADDPPNIVLPEEAE